MIEHVRHNISAVQSLSQSSPGKFNPRIASFALNDAVFTYKIIPRTCQQLLKIAILYLTKVSHGTLIDADNNELFSNYITH